MDQRCDQDKHNTLYFAGASGELDRVALFLDGLDEMLPAIQGAALNSIDREAAGLKIVLTSHPAEYQAALAGGRLYGAAVIDVLPVDVKDATAFMLAEQLGEDRRAWQQVTDHLRDYPDSVAARTLTTPLALSLARDAYTQKDSNPADLLDTGTHPDPDALLQHLLARSLTLAYPDSAEHAHATRWLSWIAEHMGSSRDLRWWDIPTWTPRWQLLLGLGAGVAVGVALHLTVVQMIWWLQGQRVRFVPLLQTALDRQILPQSVGLGDRFPRRAGEVRRGRLTGDRAGRGTDDLLDTERLTLMSGRVAFR
ncbi:hypothetical protein AB0I53_36000 [Saccharopolyspora sp. NPDC050389]|uniref:hypothetical protein n=1 Tax=Saccharopolyspora sp. NPDC050389 TaxID=3155516 RepID=UPI0033C17DA3